MVIVSRYGEIAAGSMIVPFKLGDNEKCPFSGSNHFLLLVFFFFFLNYMKLRLNTIKEEAHCSSFIVNAVSSG